MYYFITSDILIPNFHERPTFIPPQSLFCGRQIGARVNPLILQVLKDQGSVQDKSGLSHIMSRETTPQRFNIHGDETGITNIQIACKLKEHVMQPLLYNTCTSKQQLMLEPSTCTNDNKSFFFPMLSDFLYY